MRKELLFSLLLGILLVSFTKNINADETTEVPISELLDLKVDGSITPVYINITETFTFITEIIIHMDFTDANWEWENWGSGAALTNGSNTHCNGMNHLPFNVTENEDWGRITSSWIPKADASVGIKNVHIFGSLRYDSYTSKGFFINGNTFGAVVYDDLSGASTNEYEIIVKGFYDPNYVVPTPVSVVNFPSNYTVANFPDDYTVITPETYFSTAIDELDPLDPIGDFVNVNFTNIILVMLGVGTIGIGWRLWKKRR